MAEGMCSGCSLRFSSTSSFDRHQRMTDDPPHIECRDPRTVGLVPQVRTRAGARRVVWSFPPREKSSEDGGRSRMGVADRRAAGVLTAVRPTGTTDERGTP